MDGDLYAQNAIKNSERKLGMERTSAAGVKNSCCDVTVLARRQIKCRVSYEMVGGETGRCIRDAFVKDISAKRIAVVTRSVAGNLIRHHLSDRRGMWVVREIVEIRTRVRQRREEKKESYEIDDKPMGHTLLLMNVKSNRLAAI